MSSYNLNYTSSKINSLLQKGNSLVTPDVSSLILKTTASSTYITQTDMSNTYQYGTGYVLSSTLSSNKETTSAWSTKISNWATWSSNAITRARNTIYPVNSVYINWNSSTHPSFGSWTEITTQGILGQWANNYDSVNETYNSDTKNFSGGVYSVSLQIASATIAHRHIAYDFNGSGGANHNRCITSSGTESIANDAGSAIAGSATRFIRTNANTTSTYTFGDFENATCSHTHSAATFSHTGSTRTINTKQAIDAVHIYTRTA